MDEPKAVSEAQKRAHRKYMEKFVEIKVRVTPEKRTAIQEHAQTMGESATTFINRAIDHQISQDRDKGPCEAQQGPSGGGGISLHPEGLQTAQKAAQKAGETVSQFVERAIKGEVERDVESRRAEAAAIEMALRTLKEDGVPEKSRKMLEESLVARGINPPTGGKLEKEA